MVQAGLGKKKDRFPVLGLKKTANLRLACDLAYKFEVIRNKRCSPLKLMAERICKTKKIETCVSF